jgi:hypothetical protein
MVRLLSLFVGCLCAVLLASCRMADGPVPDPKEGETANRVGDLSRDLSNVAAGHADATTDFMDGLIQFVDVGDKPDAVAPVRELGNQLISAFAATKASDRAVVPLLEQVVVGLKATELSEKQVEQVKDNVRKAATDLGVDDVKARALAAQIEIVQHAVTDRHRRWYEVF